jgi:hypothetical protein
MNRPEQKKGIVNLNEQIHSFIIIFIISRLSIFNQYLYKDKSNPSSTKEGTQYFLVLELEVEIPRLWKTNFYYGFITKQIDRSNSYDSRNN